MARTYQYVVCVENRGYKAALELRKIYRIAKDTAASEHGLVRVIDESGEDYLYPERFFVVIEVPPAVVKSFSRRSA